MFHTASEECSPVSEQGEGLQFCQRKILLSKRHYLSHLTWKACLPHRPYSGNAWHASLHPEFMHLCKIKTETNKQYNQKSQLKFGWLNIHLLSSMMFLINKLFTYNQIVILRLTKTWIKHDENHPINESTPSSHFNYHIKCHYGHGGWEATIHNSNLL